jgi:hypothetical protein
MKKLNQSALAIFSALALNACGQSVDSLCTEHARLAKRMAELIVMGAANPTNFNKVEFEQVASDLSGIKGKLESKGSSGNACP